MGLFDKIKKKNEVNVIDRKIESDVSDSLPTLSNYMLSDVRKETLSHNCSSLAISKLSELGPSVSEVAISIKEVMDKMPSKREALYRVTNLEKNDELKVLKDGKTYWGAIKKQDGKSAMAKLEEVKNGNIITLDPTTIMMAMTLASIEKDLGEIKDLSKKILSFLEEDKQSEIEADLETLNRMIKELKFNVQDKQYLANNHKHVMDIKRTANKNINFYKKQISDDLEKEKLITTNQGMSSIQSCLTKKFQYYRLSLYIYSFASFLEIMLLGNYQEDYLLTKKEDLEELDTEYLENYNKALNFIKGNANKSLEGNLLSGLGNAEKAIGTLVEKVKIMKDKNVDTWLNEKGDSLKKISQDIKNNFVEKFEDISVSNSRPFINKVEEMNSIYNKTKNIYFDNEKIYLEMDREDL